MEIAPGTRLGPYEIVSRLGAGGMGEVWRAVDTRLDRAVAVKLLPRDFAQNANLKSRFEREAKTISQLHHPHICTLFDVGHEQALRYAIEIADALSKAHRQGIVHRDLKPGNVMITQSGAKLLDFGLAKYSASAQGIFTGTTAIAAPTEQKPLTAEGTIVGTLQYMAPEQLEGLDADARTDVFAFGALLYEMVTGKRAFEGRTRTSLIAAIVDREPQPMSVVQPAAPAPLERVVAVCLRKDPNDRWQSAHDVKLELESIAAGTSEVAMLHRRGRSSMPAWITIAVIALAALAAGVAHMRSAHGPVTPQRFMIAPAEKTSFDLEDSPAVISPDGSQFLLFVHSDDGDDLVVRPAGSFDYRKLQRGTYDAFWSPDSRQVGFFKDGKLKRMSVTGGSSQAVASTGDARGASWGIGDTIIYAAGANTPISAIPAGGGTPRNVTKLDPSLKEFGHWRPAFLPDGRHFLFLARSTEPDNSGIWCGSLDSLERKKIVDLDTTAIYADGHVLYVDGSDLYAQKFDAEKIAKSGEPFLVAKNVMLSRQYGSAGYSAGGGTLAYQLQPAASNPPIIRCDRKTRLRDPAGTNLAGVNLDLSRDDTRLAFQQVDSEHNMPDIRVGDLVRGATTRLTYEPGAEIGPVWSPDGRYIVYCSARFDNRHIIRRLSSGAGGEESVAEFVPQTAGDGSPALTEVVDWSRDGRYLLLETAKDGEAQNISVMDLSVPKPVAKPLVATQFSEMSARISPDGHWLAYVSSESGARQIYVQPFPPTGAKVQVSINGGESPRWRGDSRELFFVDRDRNILASAMTPRGTDADFSKPSVILEGLSDDYVVTSDGNTFYAALTRANSPSPLYVTTHWANVPR
jgi:Tol biopolymer transport system component